MECGRFGCVTLRSKDRTEGTERDRGKKTLFHKVPSAVSHADLSEVVVSRSGARVQNSAAECGDSSCQPP